MTDALVHASQPKFSIITQLLNDTSHVQRGGDALTEMKNQLC